jgi:hypothetical protein
VNLATLQAPSEWPYFLSSFNSAPYPAFFTAAISFFTSVLPFSIFTTALSGCVTSALTTPGTFSSADRTFLGQLTGQVMPEIFKSTVSCALASVVCGLLAEVTGGMPVA